MHNISLKPNHSHLPTPTSNKVVELKIKAPKTKGIKSWIIEDRPREKLIKHGPRHLTNSELLGILLGIGTKKQSAVDLARSILNLSDNNLKILSKTPLKDLLDINGIGPAKAAIIRASFELGKRTLMSAINIKDKITSSKMAYKYIGPSLEDLPHEEFWLILLDTPKSIIAKIKISEGTSNQVIIDKKKILTIVSSYQNTHSIILVHNHPSGQINPSKADKMITSTLKELMHLLDITIVDHLIIGASDYFSFSDSGIL